MSFCLTSKITSITKNEQRTKQPATATTEPGEQSAANGRSTTPSHPLRYPGRDFESFERWVRHFESMSNANNWDDQRQREVLPTCLNSYALDEYYNLLNHYFQQVQGQPAPTVARILNALNSRIDDFPNARSARTEFKNLQQLESESIQDFSRQVRKLGEAGNSHLDVAGRQEANKDAFMDGLLDSKIRYTLLREASMQLHNGPLL